MSEYGYAVMLVVGALLFLVLVDRGFSSFKISVGA